MMTLLKTVFLATCLLVGCSPVLGVAPKVCEEENPMLFEDGCTEVGGKLVIQKVDDDATLVQKLQHVIRVNKGIEVIETKIVELKCLGSIEEIRNEDGPALLFRGNDVLERIHMPKLKKLNGMKHDIIFEKDNFPAAAYENADSMADLLHLEQVSRETHKNREKCSPEFFQVKDEKQPAGASWLFYVLIALNVLAAIAIIVQVYFLWKQRKQKKKTSAGGAAEEGAASAEKADANKEAKQINGAKKKSKPKSGEKAVEKGPKEE